jgi:hypothetical protein
MAPEVLGRWGLLSVARPQVPLDNVNGRSYRKQKSRAEAPEKMNEVEAKGKVQQKTSKREAAKEYGAHKKTTMRIDSMSKLQQTEN